MIYKRTGNDKLKSPLKKIVLATLLIVLCSVNLFAGETGKISGYITDKSTGEPLIGANIIVEGTYLGAAADIDGYYFIINDIHCNILTYCFCSDTIMI